MAPGVELTIWATPELPCPAWVSAGHSTVEPLLSVHVPSPPVPTAASRNLVKFSVVPEPSARHGHGDGLVGQLGVRVVRGDGRVVPVRDLALEDLGHDRGRQLELVDAVEVVGERDGREDGREVEDLAALELGEVLRLDDAVRAGQVDDLVGQVLAALARAAAAVVDGHARRGVLERGDLILVERLRERGARGVERGAELREVLRGRRGAGGLARRGRRAGRGRLRRRGSRSRRRRGVRAAVAVTSAGSHEQREGDSSAQQAATRSCVHVPVSFVCWGTEAKVRRPGDRSCGVGWTAGERRAKGRRTGRPARVRPRWPGSGRPPRRRGGRRAGRGRRPGVIHSASSTSSLAAKLPSSACMDQ